MSDEVSTPPEQSPADAPRPPHVSLAKPTAPPADRTPPTPVHDQQTLTSLPTGPGTPGGPVPSAPWAGPAGPATPPAHPYAPPATAANPYAPPTGPANPYAPPAPTPYGGVEAVPPPPIAPDGPGQVPYGYPNAPASYGYPGQPHQQQAYGLTPYPAPAPGYGWPGMALPPSNGLGTASLVLGILAAAGFLLYPVALVLGILAVVFGVIGRAKARRGEATNPGVALAGLICGAVGIVLVVGLFAAFIAVST